MSATRGDTIRKALERGESDARLLDGRDFNDAYWRNARRQLSVLLRDLKKAQDLNEAYRVSFTGKRFCSKCGRDLHGYRGPRCRYCDGMAE